MTREELINQCRYYNGEQKAPCDGVLAVYWDLERSYVNNAHGALDEEQDRYYRTIGGKEYTGIPRGLLIWIFTSYVKQSYSPKDALPSFYRMIEDYLFVAADHFPEDEIPDKGRI